MPGLALPQGALVIGIIAAALVFAALAVLNILIPEERKLDRRARGLKGEHPAEARDGALGQTFGKLAARVPLAEAWRVVADWLSDYSAVGTQKRKLFLQAGMRHPRTYLHFELSRVALGLACAGAAFVPMYASGGFVLNPAFAIALLFLALMVGLNLPTFYLKRRIRARRQAFAEYWDDAIGLLIICLDAGLSIEVAMRRIARELAAAAPVLAEEFIITVTDLSLLQERRLAYLNLSQRMELPSVKSVTIALIQAEKQGASISNSLRTISASNRQARITTAEEKAAALGPKMTVPMVMFFLPVIFVIILAPILLTSNL
jgi:tight adherence protein C